MIAQNSVEAEIMAVCGCARYIIFFEQLLVDLGRAPKGPTKVHEDNMSTIIMMGQPHIQSTSRHFDSRYLWVKEKCQIRRSGPRLDINKQTESRWTTQDYCRKKVQD